jgi:ATP-dependent helicase HrpB
MIPLPIDPLLPELCATLRRSKNLVLEAPPGAGKTTRVPRALLDEGFAAEGEILVLEPRRLAARLSARRVAEELGESPGETIGYQMRFEDVSGPKTRVRFVTEGLLTRRLLGDRTLTKVAAVILDEIHERHLDGDLALALLRRLQQSARPDLHLVAMSATLDAAPIAAFLGDAPCIRAEGRRFEVELDHLPQAEDRPLESLVASALRRSIDEGLDGDVLVFLPGALEIRRAMESCAKLAERADLLLLPLHGSLSPAEQDRALRPADRRKVIFSTNVAETSVTIDGVVVVIDSGLARIASHAPWSGLPTLRVAKIARASATQRAGRAGRTRPGRCLRLYTKGDLAARPEHETPEIARADLAETALALFAAGIRDLASFRFLLAPPSAALEAAVTLLGRLGAIDANLEITTIGRRMLRFPLHPRLGRVLVEAERRGVAADGCVLAALVSERDLGGQTRARKDTQHGSDLLALLEAYDEAEGVDFAPERLRWMGLDPARVNNVSRVQKQLSRLVERRLAPAPPSLAARDEALSIAALAGYPDRVGRLRRPANATGRSAREIVFATGGTAMLAESSGVAEVDLVVAIDVEERSEQHPGARSGGMRGSKTTVRLASYVESDWLLDLFTDAVRDTTLCVWNEASERVEVKRRLSYEGLVLEESRAPKADPALVAAALAEAVRKKGGFRAFIEGDALDDFLARLAFARRECPELPLPTLDEATIDQHLAELCEGCASFADLRAQNLAAAIKNRLSSEQARLLAELAPETITLPGGRKLRLDYPAGEAPRAGSRLQDFFGMAQGPRVARGRVPVVLELNAPNQRAVQVTTDLAGFWAKHYPAIAKELRRKYPRHSWPDDPLTASPPEPRPPRR